MLRTVSKRSEKDWKSWKSGDVSTMELQKSAKNRTCQLWNYKNRPEYWEKSWRLEETFCFSDSSENLSTN